MILSAEHVRAMEEWETAERWRAWAVENEFAARARMVALFFPKPHEGTNNAELGDGVKIVGKFSNRYSLKDTETYKVREVAKSLPPAVADNLIRWKPEPSISGYRGLEDQYKPIFHEVLTISPEKPQITIIRGK